MKYALNLYLIVLTTFLLGKSLSFKVTFHNSYGKLVSQENRNSVFMRLESNEHKYWINFTTYQYPSLPVLNMVYQNVTIKHENHVLKSQSYCLFKATTHLIPIESIRISNDSNKQFQYEFGVFKSVLQNSQHKYGSLNNIAPHVVNLCGDISGYVPYINGPMKYLAHIKSVLHNIVKIDWIKEDQFDHEIPDFKDYKKILMRKKREDSVHISVFENYGGPYIVELGIVVDFYRIGGKKIDLLENILRAIVYMNIAFSKFNMYMIVVRLDLMKHKYFTNYDQDGQTLEYRKRLLEPRMDCAIGIVKHSINHLQGASSFGEMCSFTECYAAVHYSHNTRFEGLAYTMSHELGHTFGLRHDSELCNCVGCIMGYGISFNSMQLKWSSCSAKDMLSVLKKGIGVCLHDYPNTTNSNIPFYMPERMNERKYEDKVIRTKCGNGIIEREEQCDCGFTCTEKQKKCCDGQKCLLIGNAKCAMGACCDVDTCQLKSSGTICRGQNHGYSPVLHAVGCDLPEFCNGTSEWCPRDYYKEDGLPCIVPETSEKSRCFHGECASRLSRCQKMYNKRATVSSPKCNELSNRTSVTCVTCNCGMKPVHGWRYAHITQYKNKPCKTPEDLLCGRNWCNEDTEKSNLMLMYRKNIIKYKNEYCSGAIIHLNFYLDDIGMIPNYLDCAPGKICYKGSCQFKSQLISGLCDCNGQGVCNNKNMCHCDYGFAPPFCNISGYGGSMVSGPPEKMSILIILLVILVIVLILIFAILLIIILTYHYRKQVWPPMIVKLQKKYSRPDAVSPTYAQTPRGIYMAKSPQRSSNVFFDKEESIYVNYKPKIPSYYKPSRPTSPNTSLVKEKPYMFNQDQKKILLPPNFKRRNPPKIPRKPQLGRLNIDTTESDNFSSKRSSSLSNLLSPGHLNLNTSLRPASKIQPRSPTRSPPPQFSPKVIIKSLPKPNVSVKPKINPNIAAKLSKFNDTPLISPSHKPLIPPEKPNLSRVQNTRSSSSGKNETRLPSSYIPAKPTNYPIKPPKPSFSPVTPLGDDSSTQPCVSYPPKAAKPPPSLLKKPSSSETSSPSSPSATVTTLPPAKLPKFLKRNLISAPTLEETTHDHDTIDLLKPDDNLKREIKQHTLRKVDPKSANKYMK